MLSFDDSACVLLNAKGEMMGTRISGPISAGLRNIEGNQPGGRWAKVLAIAPKVSSMVMPVRTDADSRFFDLCNSIALVHHVYDNDLSFRVSKLSCRVHVACGALVGMFPLAHDAGDHLMALCVRMVWGSCARNQRRGGEVGGPIAPKRLNAFACPAQPPILSPYFPLQAASNRAGLLADYRTSNANPTIRAPPSLCSPPDPGPLLDCVAPARSAGRLAHDDCKLFGRHQMLRRRAEFTTVIKIHMISRSPACRSRSHFDSRGAFVTRLSLLRA
jgi:hypothetical protein